MAVRVQVNQVRTRDLDCRLTVPLLADAGDVVELIMSLEDTYGITISDEDAANLVTVRKIVDFLEKLQ